MKKVENTDTNMTLSYVIIFLFEQEGETCPLKPLVWWRYVDNLFMLWRVH